MQKFLAGILNLQVESAYDRLWHMGTPQLRPAEAVVFVCNSYNTPCSLLSTHEPLIALGQIVHLPIEWNDPYFGPTA